MQNQQSALSRATAGQANPHWFAKIYLGHHLTRPSAAHHIEMFDAVRSREKGKRYVWAAPRGHAKSTVMSLAVPLWWLITRAKRHIVLVADTSHQAEMFLAGIIQELENNHELRKDFPLMVVPALDRKGQPVAWRDREIITQAGVRVAAYGAGKAIRGVKTGEYRPDAVVVDDLENDEHVRTAEQRDKLDSWFLRALMNLGDEDTDTYMVGTILHHDSVLARRLKDPAWDARTWQAIDEHGEALWPEKWSITALERKRQEIGSIAFAAEYQNDPTAMGAGIFKDAWFKYYESVPEGLSKYAGFDPAISRRETADYSALVKVATDGERIYVLDAFEDRLSLREQEQRLISRCGDCALVGIESNAYQVVLAEELMFNSSLPIREIHAHKDKVTRAMQLSAQVESGRVMFDRYRHQDLIRQMLDFPAGAHDDLVDSLGYAVSLALEANSYTESSTSASGWKPYADDY